MLKVSETTTEKEGVYSLNKGFNLLIHSNLKHNDLVTMPTHQHTKTILGLSSSSIYKAYNVTDIH